MTYVLNHPWVIVLMIVGLGITIVAGTKFVEEIGLNKQLRNRQRRMRIKGEISNRKSSLLGALTFAPTAIFVVSAILISAFSTNINTPIVAITSGDDVMELYQQFHQTQDSTWSLFGTRTFDDIALNELEMAPTAEADVDTVTVYTAGTGSTDYSETNNQVIGVDEMDNVLTDGKFMYTMNGGEIQITLAYTIEQGPSVLDLVKSITYPFDPEACDQTRVYPFGMYVDDDQLIVMANEYQNYNYDCKDQQDEYVYYDYWYGYQSNSVKVFVYDKENDFEMSEEYTLNGYFVGTRKIDDSLFVITNKYIPYYYEDVNIDDYLPTYEVNNQVVTAQYEDIIYVNGTDPNAFTAFYGINLDTTQVDMEVILGDSGYNLYVSEDNMYLVGSVYYYYPEISLSLDRDVEITPVYEHRTAIMKVAIDDSKVDFVSVGYVEGYTLNQFSMDEYQGYLRITTTEGWGSSANNRLWVLDENLEVVSVLEGLGKPNETIRSTRFVGEYGYVVTFEQTDPFYVINLSDPENPVKEGELEIPGFSTYLQPLSNDYMLGIGFDADENGRTNGMKVAIYDITDKSNPVVFDEVTFNYEDFGWAWTSATYNHKDLLLSLDKGIIAFPFTANYYDDELGYTYNSGILLYHLDLETGFSDNYSFVQHEVDSEDYVYVYKAKFISDYLYAISNKYITVSTLEDPETILYSEDIYVEEVYYYYGEVWVD